MECPKCKHKMAKNGFGWSGTHQYQAYKCLKCGAVKLDHTAPKQKETEAKK